MSGRQRKGADPLEKRSDYVTYANGNKQFVSLQNSVCS